MSLADTGVGSLLAPRCFHRPVFVVGTGRSGTSVLTRALGRHPRILAASREAPFIASVGELAAVLVLGTEKERAYQERTLRLGRQATHERLRRLCFETAFGVRLSPLPALRDLAGGLAARRKPMWGVSHWCAKTFPTRRSYEGLVALYPAAKFLYIVRNGLDVVRSRTRYPGFRDDDFRSHCEEWARSTERFAYLEAAPAALRVRHERLVEDPERLFRDITGFLEVPYRPGPVDLVTGTLVSPLEQPTRTGVEVRRVLADRPPPYEGWSREDREVFRRVCGAAMSRLRYEIPYV